MLGVLGGMGPLATADFLQKLARLNPAVTEQDHPQVIVFSNPKIPDRVGPILGTGAESPLPALLDGARRLQEFGAILLAMPCHTAHFWHGQIAGELSIPFIHIADSVCDELVGGQGGNRQTVGILATQATLKADIYQQRLRQAGMLFVLPSEQDMRRDILPAIAGVKRNALRQAGRHLAGAIKRMRDQGANCVILACTELPVALDYINPHLKQCCLDPTETLAQACISFLRRCSNS